VEDRGYKAPTVVVDKALREEINQVLDTLSQKEADIIQYRFGLNGRRPMSLKEIGSRYKLTRAHPADREEGPERLQHPRSSPCAPT
jgi:RNA polymerase primary sigma factor